MGYGLPFAAIGAGYALSAGWDWLAQRSSLGRLAGTAAVVIVVLAVVLSGRFAKGPVPRAGDRHGYPGCDCHQAQLRPGTLILSDGASRVEQYYLPAIPPSAWTRAYTHTAQQKIRIADQIRSCLVSVVVLLYERSRLRRQPYDPAIVLAADRTGSYQLAAVAAYGAYRTAIWKMRPEEQSPRGRQ
jgi:hypothetical protein